MLPPKTVAKAAQFGPVERGKRICGSGRRVGVGGLPGFRDGIEPILKTAHGTADGRAGAPCVLWDWFFVAVGENLKRQRNRHIGELLGVLGIAAHQVIEHGGVGDRLGKRKRIERVLERSWASNRLGVHATS